MSSTVRPRRPLILVTDDLEAMHWDATGESELFSRLAVCQDIWGRNCFAPGQVYSMKQAAIALAVNKTQIFASIGSSMGGLGPVSLSHGVHIEVFEANPILYEHNVSCPQFLGKLLKLERWKPGTPALKANRYHSLSMFGAFAAAQDVKIFASEVRASLKAGGYLYVDEIWANDKASAARVAVAASLWQDELCYRSKGEVIALLAHELELRSTNEANRLVKGDIREGLVKAQIVAQKLKLIPEPMRKQRLIALTQELQRAVVLYDALDRELVTATRYIFHKKADTR